MACNMVYGWLVAKQNYGLGYKHIFTSGFIGMTMVVYGRMIGFDGVGFIGVQVIGVWF